MPQETRNERQLPAVFDSLSSGSCEGSGRGRAREMLCMRRRHSRGNGSRPETEDSGVCRAEYRAGVAKSADASTARDAAAAAPDSTFTVAVRTERISDTGDTGDSDTTGGEAVHPCADSDSTDRESVRSFANSSFSASRHASTSRSGEHSFDIHSGGGLSVAPHSRAGRAQADQPVPRARSQPPRQTARPRARVGHGGLLSGEAFRRTAERNPQGALSRGDKKELR